jgi:hypothetical protein
LLSGLGTLNIDGPTALLDSANLCCEIAKSRTLWTCGCPRPGRVLIARRPEPLAALAAYVERAKGCFQAAVRGHVIRIRATLCGDYYRTQSFHGCPAIGFPRGERQRSLLILPPSEMRRATCRSDA